jgi:integrase
MAGVNPAFMARQLGHSLDMFFKVYAKWIDV